MSEVNYFSFSDLEKKWDVNSEQLHKLIASGDLIPSLFFNDKKIIKAFNYQYYAEDNLPLSVYLAFSRRKIKSGYDEIPVKDSRGNYSGWHYLIFPVLNGTSKYYFQTSTKNIDNYIDHGVFYKHYEESDSKTQKQISFDNKFIEDYAEFEKSYIAIHEKELIKSAKISILNLKAGSLPEYFSEDLQILVSAAYNFWSTYDAEDTMKPSSNKEVENWLISRGFSKRNAEAGATIIRLDSRRGDLNK